MPHLYYLQLVTVAHPEVVLELGGGIHSPWMALETRGVLTDILAQKLRVKVGKGFLKLIFITYGYFCVFSRANHAPLLSQNTDGSASLVIPW